MSLSARSTAFGDAVLGALCLSSAGSGVQFASMPRNVFGVSLRVSCRKKSALSDAAPRTGAYAATSFLGFPRIWVTSVTTLPSGLCVMVLRTRVIACCSVSPFFSSKLSYGIIIAVPPCVVPLGSVYPCAMATSILLRCPCRFVAVAMLLGTLWSCRNTAVILSFLFSCFIDSKFCSMVLHIPLIFLEMNLGPGCGWMPSSLILRIHPCALVRVAFRAPLSLMRRAGLRFLPYPTRALLSSHAATACWGRCLAALWGAGRLRNRRRLRRSRPKCLAPCA